MGSMKKVKLQPVKFYFISWPFDRFPSLDLTEGLKQNNNSEEPIKGAGILAEELREMEREWLRKRIEQEEADKELARKLQEELDQEAKSTRSLVNRSKGSKDEYQLRTKIVKNQPTIEASFQRPSIRKSNPPPWWPNDFFFLKLSTKFFCIK